MSATLDDTRKALMFKALATKSSYDVGVEFGLDKFYKNAATVTSTVNRVYSQVKNNPEKFAVTPDLVELVVNAVQSRSIAVRSGEARTTLREKLEAENSKTFEELALDNRAKAWKLLSLRLDDALSSKRKREKVSLGEIAKVAGIAFDKGQLIEGKATDHVSLMSKIETKDMSPADAIDTILKMREYNQALSEKK